MRTEYRFLRVRARIALIAVLTSACMTAAPRPASAGLFDFLFGGSRPAPQAAPAPAPQMDFPLNPFGPGPAPVPPPVDSGIRGAAFCVRLCDGRYFPVQARGGATAAQMCQAFCPASVTKTFAGSHIDRAVAPDGSRYGDLDNAYLFREKLLPDCTCNGRDGLGLAAVDISFDTTLRPGDIIATSTGLVAYSGSASGRGQTAEFTPVSSYPGLTPEVRAKLAAMKVAPATAEVAEDRGLPASDVTGAIGNFRAGRAEMRE